ncbi:Asp23/Gls24 family envelope stress response protein [Gehongia tenuis]|jgi:uncharacterized alkaline shock family protein YloU|uniref:Asp23/Gls24 family envelope stress response protein n=1 Tax=Gehongia tenuis TaxID=2763655 RepID=A0A926D5K0_9FIRM|nr:Asp23/Gls24 family envelope stress response protein [Gehongia tenuis]MBC8530775.1 Asp23/Gls24 family envelope stress response protein [Gehongia tenuis]
MPGKIVNTLGTIQINDDVVAMLAGMATVECYGIVGMASKRATDGIVELLGRENLSRGVKVTTKESAVVIDLYVIMEYGTTIATVASNVVDTVKYTVEKTTGLTVEAVNVTVEGIRL